MSSAPLSAARQRARRAAVNADNQLLPIGRSGRACSHPCERLCRTSSSPGAIAEPLNHSASWRSSRSSPACRRRIVSSPSPGPNPSPRAGNGRVVGDLAVRRRRWLVEGVGSRIAVMLASALVDGLPFAEFVHVCCARRAANPNIDVTVSAGVTSCSHAHLDRRLSGCSCRKRNRRRQAAGRDSPLLLGPQVAARRSAAGVWHQRRA